jgi:hypothetical protein
MIIQVFGGEGMSHTWKVQTHKTEKGEIGEVSKTEACPSPLFDVKGIAHKEFVLAGQTVISAYYCDVLQ